MRLLGVIVAGGRARRMGFDKIFATVGGKTILERTIAALAPQVDLLLINANERGTRFATTGLAIIADEAPELATPLAGIHAGLRHASAHGFDAVLTVPADCPFLPADLAKRLAPGPAVAASGSETHFLTGLWPIGLLGSLEAALADGLSRVKDWAARSGAVPVAWPTAPFDPFLNLNTPEDLLVAERIARRVD